MEIISSERTYLEALRRLMDVYVNPLDPSKDIVNCSGKSSNNLLKVETFRSIFPTSLEVIVKTNETLLQRLTSEPLHKLNVGKIFLEMSAFFKCYTAFVSSFDSSREALLSTMKSNSKFSHFIKKHQKNSENNLSSLLIWPVQRLPRYILLLQELLKYTPKNYAHRITIKKALNEIKQVTSLLNNNKQLADMLMKVLELEKRLKFEHNIARKLLREGEGFVSLFGSRNTTQETLAFYLFSDCFICAKRSRNYFKTKDDLRLKHNFPLVEIDGLKTDESNVGFSIAVRNQGEFLVNVIGSDQSVAWLNDLKAAIKAAYNSKQLLDSVKKMPG